MVPKWYLRSITFSGFKKEVFFTLNNLYGAVIGSKKRQKKLVTNTLEKCFPFVRERVSSKSM